MKAAYITRYGGTEVIRFGELPDPVLTRDKVLVRIHAVSVNPIDNMIRQGMIRLLSGSKFPKVLGCDFAGIVIEAGSNVTEFSKGDRIYGIIPLFFGNPGAMSEVISVSPKRIRKKPDEMTFEEAASMPVAALTALNGLRKAGDLNGKLLLVNGATGGVGHFAVQIGKAKGAKVTATCSTKNINLAKQLGAEEIVDYSQDGLARLENQFDMILDATGKMKYHEACRLLKNKGVSASTLFLPPAMLASLLVRLVYDKKLTSANFRARPEDWEEIEKLFRENRIKPFIGGTFSPEDAKLAFEMIEQGRARGKTIVKWN